MPRALVVLIGVTLGLCTGLAAQQLHPPPPNGPRPNIVPNPAARTKSEAGPLFPESTHVAPPTPDPILADHDLNVGKFYYNRGDYVGALARFDDAIYNNPSLTEAYCRAGDTLWKMHRLQPARSEWSRCALLARGGQWGEHARKQLANHKGESPSA